MVRKAFLAAAALALVATTVAAADEPRMELSLNVGGTASSGINSNEVAPSGQPTVYVEVRPKNGFSWGAEFGYFVNEKLLVGGLLSVQKSELQVTGPNAWKQVGEGLDLQNMLATVAIHTGDSWSRTRFYAMGGLGATRFGEVTIQGIDVTTIVGGKTKFATTWGVGVKHYPNPRLGMKLGLRWTPAYLGETAGEWVCSPYLACTVAGTNSQYSHQYELAGGVMFRF